MILELDQKVYYQKNCLIVRSSTMADVEYLSTRLRESDREEILASNNVKPYEALSIGLKESVLCLTVENNKEVIFMFGINAEDLTSNHAIIWMLASDKIDSIQHRFLRHSRRFINIFLDMYPNLENYVAKKNVKSLEWLRRCGAIIEQEIPYGIEAELFHRFTFKRGN